MRAASTSTTASLAQTGSGRAYVKRWRHAGAVMKSSLPSSTAWRGSVGDARNIADELTRAGVKLNLGGAVYDPTDPVGKLLFNVLSMGAEFEADLIRQRTREGMAIARATGKLKGRKPRLSERQETHLLELHRSGGKTPGEPAELFSVGRSTVYRAIARASGGSS